MDIFSDNVYNKLNQAYNQELTTKNSCLLMLDNIISTLQTNNFQLPLRQQNQILNHLSQAKQILNILFKSTPTFSTPTNFTNNPFSLIEYLTNLSKQLTSHSLKSAHQILSLKANQFVLQSVQDIAQHFANKNFKTFKFM